MHDLDQVNFLKSGRFVTLKTRCFTVQAQDAVTAEKLAKGGHIRTGRVKSGPKLLKCQIILNAAHSAKAVNPGNTKPKKLKGLARKPVQQSKAIAPREVTNAVDSTDSLNVWDEEASMAAPPISKKKGDFPWQAIAQAYHSGPHSSNWLTLHTVPLDSATAIQ